MSDNYGNDDGQTIEVPIQYALPQADLFFRDQPAISEGPSNHWAAARAVIDFGSALLVTSDQLRDERRIRDAVLATLLRRALITAEGIFTLLSRGLEEPGVALTRTLQDIELNIRLVTDDSSDRMAKRLAAYHYYGSQKHGQDMLSDPATREGPLTAGGRVQEVIAVAHSYAKHLESDAFDDVRDEVKQSRYWHGHNSVEQAFAAVGQSPDYHMSYDSCTFFVHDTNIDFDFSTLDDAGLHLKPLVQRNPAVNSVHLANAAMRLYAIIDLFIEDRGLPPSFAESLPSATGDPSDSEPPLSLNSFEGLTHLVIEHFKPRNEGGGD